MSIVVMGDPKTVLEGGVKYRDKKKWKSRWAVVSKLSPVADCLHIQLYRDSKERCKNGPTKASLSLEEFLGMETGFTLDKESNTMALICSELVVVLAFDNRELLIQWQVKIRANLVEEQQFLVQIAHVPPKSKLPCGPARLHLQDHNFCLVSSVPPRLLGTWPIKELRRFGVVEGKFCFEGGSLCGKGEGLHVLLTNQCEELSRSMDLASKGKLLGKRKTLTRKNSVLETSSRGPLHKRCHMDKSGDSSLPVMSSGSECSTCDACSEVLRTADACVDDIMYASSSASVKASSCRIHYRWPSCLSRWGQSSTTTTSDVDSVDTVSVILSDFQGSHSGTMSKTNGHGQSMSCLCDTQGTWPFNQCSKCGRQLYSRHSLQSCKSSKPSSSPERSAMVNEDRDAFSPQWTMDSVVGSRKDQNNSTPDRASLCSRASHSSSNSGASSSGSEYSVPKNFLETLYDKPKHVQQAMNGTANGKTNDPRRTIDQQPSSDKCMLCPCHEPMADWLSAREKPPAGHPDCACWSKLAMAAVRSEVDIRMVNGRKSASANPSPSSSPKKLRYGASTTLRSGTNSECEMHCTCGKGDPYANYAIPKSAMMHPKDVPLASGKMNGSKDAKMFVPAAPAEDYDVPKKFQDLLSNCDMTQKSSAIKSISNGPSCSCMSACKIVQNIELFKMASKQQHSFVSGDGLQMCACQRVMLWAGSLVPCLGPQRPSLDAPAGEWQCPRSWLNNHPKAVCSEPHRTAEVVMVNGKTKHVLREASVDSSFDAAAPPRTAPMRPRASTVSYPLTTDANGASSNYANLEFASSEERLVKVSDEPSAVNYANIEFAETLSLYENSSLVLSRMETSEAKDEPSVCANKPPLPPRSSHAARKQCESPERDKEKCKCKQPTRSPKKTNAVNGSAYEMMSYPKNPSYSQSDEDYLMMQPLCVKSNESSPSKQITDGAVATTNQIAIEEPEPDISTQSTLPLRPFMPYSYPISESGAAPDVFATDSLSRKNQLISEELHLRAMRSNSLSELKKKVLMRKRSSSVDGKNNGYLSKDSGVESVPNSPVGSPRPSAQRKNSLFSKLTLRSKEKSMSTNEIALPPLPAQNGTSSNLAIAHKNGHHRSADCLKPSEDFTNSDEDLNSDNSDFVLHKDSAVTASPMKRSSSVPCRAAMPTVTVTSPAKGVNCPVEELNDLNKEPSSSVVTRHQEEDEEQEPVQRKYSLDSHERKKRVLQGVRSNCDNMYRQEGLDESDTVMEMQGILRRNHIQSERGTVAENYRSNTSSCSSSDISDYMESLSFISRSSSSSSGSADYMRSEDIYGRTLPKPPPQLKSNGALPAVHQSRCFGGSDERALKHRSFNNDGSDSSSESASYHPHPCFKPKDESNPRPCTSICRNNRDSRSSTSSTSSLSTSPSVTDYSSSSSSSPQCPNSVCGSRQVFDRRKQELLGQPGSAFVYNNCADKDQSKKA